MKALTDSQIQNFNENGYLLVEDALSPDDLNPLIAEFEEIVDTGASQLYAEGELDSEFKTEGFDTRLAKITEQSPVVFQKVFSGAHTGPALFDLLINPKLLDIAESLVGPRLCVTPHTESVPNSLNTTEPSFRGIKTRVIWSLSAIRCYNSRSGFR